MRTSEETTTYALQGRTEAIMATTTTTHQLVSSGSISASTAGGLNGHQAVCSCGFVARTSLPERFAVTDLLGHISYMERKARR
jgi:hypothetical protein